MVSWLAPSARTSEAVPDCRPLLTAPSSGYTAFHSTCVIQRYSNGKTCLPKRKMVSTLTSCDVDHVLKWTRLSVRISAVGSKVMRKYIAGEPGDEAMQQVRVCACALGVRRSCRGKSDPHFQAANLSIRRCRVLE